ncbi:MAG: RAMP superfamily CRISPR-associated protein [Blastocatellia bacterium]
MPHNATPKPFRLQLHLLSDWHIGSGAGRPGDVDRLVRRDQDGLPFIPAKTLTGIWRDGCERTALGLDNGTPGAWCRWLQFLFGEQPGQPDEDAHHPPPAHLDLPCPAALSVRSAHFPATLRAAIKGQPAVHDAVTFVKPGVAIDPLSGRARADYLRFEEMARGGVTLTACGQIDFSGCSEEQQQAATALLLAGVKLVERIGAKRRRGAGRCTLEIQGLDVAQWLAVLDTDAPPEPPAPPAAETFNLQTMTSDDEWECVTLCLTAKTPLLIAEQTIGNLVKSLDYLPGTYLLPILRRKLGAEFKEGCDINTAIFSGQLLVTHATIAINDAPGRPVPFALFHEKVGGGLKSGRGVYNRLQEGKGKAQLKGHRSGYLGVTPAEETRLPDFQSVALAVEPHNVVRDAIQRPDEAVGGVFSYEVIPQGTELRAQLQVRKSLLKAPDSEWLAALKGECKIGRAKKDDYGWVTLTASKAEHAAAAPTVQNELTVWLLSDVLLRDERLRPTASVERLRQVLSAALGVTLTDRTKMDDNNDERMHAISRTHRTDSWHVGWGLPRPSLVGLQAGTCVVFQLEGTLDADKLARVAAEGIGERRAEGYGRLCFNEPFLSSPVSGRTRQDDRADDDPVPAPIGKEQTGYAYAAIIERAAARKEIQRCAMGLAADPQRRELALGIYVRMIDRQPKSEPSLSQLGTLRSALTRLQQRSDRPALLDWLAHLKEKREDKWPAGRQGEEHSLRKLRNLLENEDCVWSKLQVDFTRLELTQGGTAQLKEELWGEVVRTLVDACIRAQKRETEKGDQTNGTQA